MKEVTSSYHAEDVESAVRTFWNEEDIYRKVKEMHAADPDYFFVDGPPYTTGHIHLGTAWNKIIKDSMLRFERMQGQNVIDRAGYDMHGLPIEVRVDNQRAQRLYERFGFRPVGFRKAYYQPSGTDALVMRLPDPAQVPLPLPGAAAGPSVPAAAPPVPVAPAEQGTNP